MIRRSTPFILLLVALLCTGCPPDRTTGNAFENRSPSSQILDFLAADAQEGRGIGSEGLGRSATAIETRFKELGLQPVPGSGGFSQSFIFTTGSSVDPRTKLRLNDQPAELDKAFRPFAMSANNHFAAPVVFAGYGIDNGDDHTLDYNDYLDLDVTGKAVLVLRYEPRDKDGNSIFTKSKAWSQFAMFDAKAKLAKERGAVALLVVDPSIPGLLPFSTGGGEGVGIPVITVTRDWADNALKTGKLPSSAELKAKIDEHADPQSAPLPGVQVGGTIEIVKKSATVRNELAMLPGAGSTADEYVVVGAHYDHLGKGRGKTPEIFHGADDNASGTTAMLETAERLKAYVEQHGPLKRSVLFAAFTAEEEGLIGSAYFVSHPTVPLNKIVAMVNLDMVGRVRNQTLYVGGGGTAAGFHDLLKAADDASPLALKSMGEGGLGPSDHMSFALKKIPVIFFFSGLHADYHRPTDTVDKINRAGIDEVADLTENIVDRLAELPRQQYVSKADAMGENVSIGFASVTGGRRVTLGVVPDYTAGTSDSSVNGVKISGTSPDSPAAKAGLQEGDVIVKLGATKIESLEGLSAALRTAEAGKPTSVTIERGGKTIELPVTLVEKN